MLNGCADIDSAGNWREKLTAQQALGCGIDDSKAFLIKTLMKDYNLSKANIYHYSSNNDFTQSDRSG